MIPKNIDINILHKLFIEGLAISSIADQLDTVESEIHYALAKLRKKDPEMWPKRNLGYVREREAAPLVLPVEKVVIKSSFTPIRPPVEKVNSEVITRKMTPEEIDRLNRMGRQTTDSMGAKIPKINNYFRKPIEAKESFELKTELTKELYLSEKAAGKNNAKIERDWNLKPNSLYPLIKKWEYISAKTTPQKDVKSEIGLTALNASRETEQSESSAAAKLAIANQLELSRFKDTEIERLKQELTQASIIQSVVPASEDKLTAILNYVRELAGPDPRSAIFDQVSKERQRQDSLHPHFPREIRTDVLLEEFGEVAKAKLDGNQSDLRKELIEVAAVAVRWIEMLDHES